LICPIRSHQIKESKNTKPRMIFLTQPLQSGSWSLYRYEENGSTVQLRNLDIHSKSTDTVRVSMSLTLEWFDSPLVANMDLTFFFLVSHR